ncbi:MAG TPA: RIP metalloprotease RseP [Candidatus Binatia bacterium]|nr:RIP metalloprotease RseP [Candidatus Binatia bacterium]
MITSIAAAVVVLGFLIVVHELGHFLVAKRVGVRVLRFSIGFGPRLFGWRSGETEYALSAVPFGGYVKMEGEDSDADLDEATKRVSFAHQPVSRRFAIVFAGPGTNIFFAFVIFCVTFIAFGVRIPSDQAKVGGLSPNMPAAAAGLQPGDLVLSVDSQAVNTWDELSQTIRKSGGRTLTLKIQRDGDVREMTVTPKEVPNKSIFGEDLGTSIYLIGIEPGLEVKNVGVLESVGIAAEQTVTWAATITMGLIKMVTGKIPSHEIGGPIEIVRQAGKQAALGIEFLLMFTAVISLNLGILNLLPIPVLDGGHLFFFAIEGVLGRPIELRYRELAQQVGLFVLIALMLFAFYNDIARVLQG